MAKYCPNCGAEIKEGSKFCGSCGASLEYIERKSEKVIKRKNPWAAAILNFLLPGIGFIYLETFEFVIGGTALFLVELIVTVLFWTGVYNPTWMTASFLFAFFWAVLGYIGAEYVNRRK